MTGVACFSLLLKFPSQHTWHLLHPAQLEQSAAGRGAGSCSALHVCWAPAARPAATDLSAVTPTRVLLTRGMSANSGVCSLPKIAAASHRRRQADANERVSRDLRAPRPVPAGAERPQGHGLAAPREGPGRAGHKGCKEQRMLDLQEDGGPGGRCAEGGERVFL